MGKIRVGLLFGGKSPEHEISILSAKSVLNNINRKKYEVIPIGISKNGYWLSKDETQKIITHDQKEITSDSFKNDKLPDSLIPFLQEEFDIIFPLLHGPNGEDGKVQGFLDMINIPYVGTGVMSSALGMDKAFMKKLFAYQNFPQGDFFIIKKNEWQQAGKDIRNNISKKIGFPCFIKPANMGSSIGISRVEDKDNLHSALETAFKYDNKVVIEEYISGREIECSVLGINEIRASLPGEIIPGNKFYDYQAKYEDKSTELKIPALLDNQVIDKIKDLAIRAFKAIDGEGFGRIDFFLDNNDIYINEINTIPGFTEYSMYPKLWEVSGLPYEKLIGKLIEMTLNHHNN